MYSTFKTSREALENVRISYAEILKQASDCHTKVIDIAGPDEIEHMQKILQGILSQSYPIATDEGEIQSSAAALYTAICSAYTEAS